MDILSFSDFLTGLGAACAPMSVAMVGLGVLVGMVFGAAPGLTATAGVAIVTPLTYGVGFESAMGILLGIYCGGYFAGSIPAILVNTPGAPGNSATAIDGYAMARRGEAGRAISLATMGSFIGGVASGVLLLFFAPLLSGLALRFTAVEYVSFGLFGLVCVAAISRGNITTGAMAACMGLILGCVGIDPVTGAAERLTFGIAELATGVELMPALIAFFCVAEMLNQGGTVLAAPQLPPQRPCRVSEVARDFLRNKWLVIKSMAIGAVIGVLPGTGPTIASWIAYGGAPLHKEGEPDLGQGAPRGIIAPEVANNAVTGGATIPLLTLGIPGDTVTAVLLGALMIQNVTPGPFFVLENGAMFSVIIVSLMLGNTFLLVAGLSLRRVLPRLLTFPPALTLPVIGLLAVTGAFAAGNSTFNVLLVGILGVGGWLLSCLGLPLAPLVLGLVLSPIIERNFRDAMVVNDMDWTVFFTRPVSAGLLAAAVGMAAFMAWRSHRETATAGGEEDVRAGLGK